MKIPSIRTTLALISLALPLSSFAWNKGGHQIVAAIAYKELSPEKQAEASELLTFHPSFSKWSTDHNKYKTIDFDTYIFMRAAMWPDDIRSATHPDHAQHRAKWHYMNYPLRPTTYLFEIAPDPNNNILSAIQTCLDMLQDSDEDPTVRAVHLAWLIHLIGDLHQPLHSSALFTTTFVTGDHGGNDFFIRPGMKAIKLHSFWDDLLGTSAVPKIPHQQAIALRAKYPRASFPVLTTSPAPLDWTKETRQLAIDNAYATLDFDHCLQPDPSPIPASYNADSKALAEKQATLAGYRLADLVTLNLAPMMDIN